MQALPDKLESRIPGTLLGLLWWCFVLFRALLGFTWVFVLRQSAHPSDRLSTRPPVCMSARARPRPRLFRPSACPRPVGPVRPSTPLSAPFPPPSARSSAAFPPRPLVRSSARLRRQRMSACPPVHSVHASSATSTRPVRHVRSARAR